MKSNSEKLLSNLELAYSNIYNLLNGISSSLDTEFETEIELKEFEKDSDNIKTKLVKIKSLKQIYNDISKFERAFESLTTGNKIALNQNGVVKTFTRDISNNEYLNKFSFKPVCVVDENNSLFEDFAFPLIKLPIELDKKIPTTNKVVAKIYEVSEGFDLIKDETKEIELHQLIKSGKVIATSYSRDLSIQKQHINLFGKFNIEQITQLSSSEVKLKLNSLFYSSKVSLKNNIQLKPGDVLIYENRLELIIKDVIVGSDEIIVVSDEAFKVGFDKLFFEQKTEIDTNNSFVLLPVKPVKKMVCFFSTENNHFISFPSNGLKIDTTDFQVTYEDTSYTIDEFYGKFVFNFSEYLKGIMNDSNIPHSLGIKPDKPVLNQNNFKVVQINKHLIDSKTKNEIEKLNKQKQAIQNDIDYREDIVKRTQTDIDTQKFNSIEEKTYLQNKIINLREEINVLKTNLLTIVRDIDTYANKKGIKGIVPKYKVIGYWEIQDPIFSTKTPAQHIIKYEVMYRYLTRGVDTIETTTFKMIDKGEEVNVAFSNWIQYHSKTLNRIETINGKHFWEKNNVSDADEININQCSISINEAESVEIKVRAITEAGYPLSPMKSDWSEIIRIDFPDYLKDSNIRNNIEKNQTDLAVAEFNQLLSNSGLLQHINGQIKEGDKLFMHHAKDISSGQYTPEQKNIPLDVLLNTIMLELNKLKGNNNSNNLVVSFINEKNERYNITNNTTLDIFAGNYSDEVDIVNPEKYGYIISKKFYISLKNVNNEPLELRSLVSTKDSFKSQEKKKFWGVPIIVNGETNQKHQQIIYFRNQGLFAVNSNEDKFIQKVSDTNFTSTRPTTEFIKYTAPEQDRNLYVSNENNTGVELIKLNDEKQQTSEFIGFTKEIESVIPHLSSDKNEILSELKRLSSFGNLLSEYNKQLDTENTNNSPVGFRQVDLYAVGKNSCGAWLYPFIDKNENFIVNGENTTSFMLIEPNTEILIPIIFEYRMTDRFGNIYSLDENQDALALNLEYRKKLGVSLKLNSTEFNFDIQFNAKYRSKISTLDNKNVSKLIGAYNNETKETLN